MTFAVLHHHRQSGGAVATPWYLSGSIDPANCIAAYQPKGAADIAASYVNLANPGTYNAAPGTAPTFAAATGWTFANASSQYLVTGIVPAGTWTFAIRYSDAVNGGYISFGVNDGSTSKRIQHYPNFVNFLAQYGNNQYQHGSAVSSGTLVFYRSSSDSKIYSWVNGVPNSASAATTWANPSIALFIGASNLSGSPDSFGSVKIQAWAAYNTNLSGAQITALYTAMAAL